MIRCFGSSLALAGLVAIANAQTTILVGPGGYPQIDAALAVAMPGDVIDVSAGGYAPFTANIGVSIIANGAVTIGGNGPPFTWYLTSMNVPAGQTLHVHGLRFTSYASTLPHDVRVLGGQVVFESCTFEGGHPAKVYQALDCAAGDVVLRRCTFPSDHRCLRVSSGLLQATDCRFLPREGPQIGVPPFGVEIAGGTAQFSFCELRGANDLSSPGTGGSAVRVGAIGKLRLSDCNVTGGDSTTGPPVPAVVNEPGGVVEHARGSVVGGFGWVWLGFTMWQQRGPAFVGANVVRQLPGSIAIASGLASGTSFLFACAAAPGSLMAVAMSPGLTPPTPIPFGLDPIRFNPAAATFPFFAVTDAQGLWTSPAIAVPTGLVGASVWFHPLLLDSAGLVVGVPVGGVVHG